MGATSYMRWFVARGRFSHDEADARPGDLVVWKNGHHIGIYVGPNRAISALNERLGVRVHDLNIPESPSQYLLINWGTNDGGGDNGGGDNGGGDNPASTPPPTPDDGASTGNGASNGNTDFAPPDSDIPEPTPTAVPPTPKPPVAQPPADASVAAGQAITDSAVGALPAARPNRQPTGFNGVAIATVNLRELPDSESRIVDWLGTGGYVHVISRAFSPQGYLYYQVETVNGKTGWIYSRWVLETPQ